MAMGLDKCNGKIPIVGLFTAAMSFRRKLVEHGTEASHYC